MPYDVFATTAENIIGATDAALQIQNGVEENIVSEFLDIQLDSARNALGMACQLGLITEQQGVYKPSYPFAPLLVTSSLPNKAAILRLVLEQYEPYKTFKRRLVITRSVQDAANQTLTIHNIGCHREDILNTFINLGTFANSLSSEGAGNYTVLKDDPEDYLAIVNEVIEDREQAVFQVIKRLGNEAVNWINNQEVLEPLVTAYQRAGNALTEPRSPIVYAGNSIESFLSQVAHNYTVNVQNAHGINAKADVLFQNGSITRKHLNMLKYLGHVRNAADHGTDPDPDVGCTWEISPNTSIEYVHVSISVITAIVAHIHGRFIV